MSGLVGAFVAVAIVAVSLAGSCWLVRRLRRAASQVDQIIDAAVDRTAAREVDELELLYSLPAYDPARDAIRDEQQKNGDQT